MAKILVVDDDSRTAEFVSSYLRAAGHDCLIAHNGEKAIDAARSDGADLLILDVMLPGGASGFEVCRRIRSDSELYTLPILMLSAMGGEEEIAHGLAQGADDYIAKPFDVHNLLLRVEALLRSNNDIAALDDMTSLPYARATKREVQRRIMARHDFALACVELVHLREFARQSLDEATSRNISGRNKAIRHLARALKLCAENMPATDFMVGHMGGGYFVCILNPAEAEAYCNYVMKAWQYHLPALYESVGLQKVYEEAVAHSDGKAPLLNLLICVTPRRARGSHGPQNLFDVLTQIRNSALAAHSAGIHFDRRA